MRTLTGAIMIAAGMYGSSQHGYLELVGPATLVLGYIILFVGLFEKRSPS